MISRPLTKDQVTALLYFARFGSARAAPDLNPASITTLVALGYLKMHRETREYAVTEAGRRVALDHAPPPPPPAAPDPVVEKA